MTALQKKRKGFSLVEMVAVAIILAIITIACVLVMQSTASMRIQSRNSIYMTTHNLNVMEKLRQEINRLGIYGELHPYYGFADDTEEYNLLVAEGKNPDDKNNYRADYSTDDIRTEVYIEICPWNNFHLYNVRIESKIIGYPQRLTNTFVLTDIGIEKDPTLPEEEYS